MFVIKSVSVNLLGEIIYSKSNANLEWKLTQDYFVFELFSYTWFLLLLVKTIWMLHTITKRLKICIDIKANHLAYIEPSWYGSRISADCQQKWLFMKHDTGGDFY